MTARQWGIVGWAAAWLLTLLGAALAGGLAGFLLALTGAVSLVGLGWAARAPEEE